MAQARDANPQPIYYSVSILIYEDTGIEDLGTHVIERHHNKSLDVLDRGLPHCVADNPVPSLQFIFIRAQ